MDVQRKGVNGLANIANNCYVNTGIQCLGHCPVFLDYVLNGKYESKEGELIYELKKVLEQLWVKDNSIIPTRFLRYMQMHLRELNIAEQNDIQEFLVLFIDKMNRSISIKLDTAQIMEQISYNDTTYDKLRKKVDIAWLKDMGHEYSKLVEMFYGQSVIQIICGHCQKIHHQYEPFSILFLPLSSKENETLNDCLKNYMCEEYLNEHDATDHSWTCDGCKKSVKSLKTTKLWRFPKILMICVKRFTYDLNKNNKVVDVPLRLDMEPYSLNDTERKYELKSVACHVGTFSRGHYYAICKNDQDQTWYYIDDTRIHKIPRWETPSHFYMGFYELVS